MVKYLRTKQFVPIKQNFGIHKIRNRQITLYIALCLLDVKLISHVLKVQVESKESDCKPKTMPRVSYIMLM